MIATITPSTTPITIDVTVSSTVPRRPSSTGPVNRTPRLPGPYETKMNFQSNWSFVSSTWANIAASTPITAMRTQRPGCRTGTALIGSGRARSLTSRSVIDDSDGRVHRGVGDGAGVDAPLRQDRLVGAVGDQRLQRALDRDGHRVGLVLGQHVAVRRRGVDVADQRQLAVGLLHRVRTDRRVGEH